MTLKVRILQFGGSNNFNQIYSKKFHSHFCDQWSIEKFLSNSTDMVKILPSVKCNSQLDQQISCFEISHYNCFHHIVDRLNIHHHCRNLLLLHYMGFQCYNMSIQVLLFLLTMQLLFHIHSNHSLLGLLRSSLLFL